MTVIDEIDAWRSPCKAIVLVLMLKKGWDMRNKAVGFKIDDVRLGVELSTFTLAGKAFSSTGRQVLRAC